MSEAATQVPVSEQRATEQALAQEKDAKHHPLAPRDWMPLDAFRRDMERVFSDFYRSPWRLPFTRSAFDIAPAWPGEFLLGSMPAVDIIEKDQNYVITAEMPGMQASDVAVSISEERLTIKGEKKSDKKEEQKGVHLSERRYGSFSRTFRIPEGVSADKIEASFANGVLTVTLPKTGEKPTSERRINVTAA